MIKLIVLDNPRLAQAFIDYMASRGIPVDMMPEGGGMFAVWLKDNQYQIEAESELQHFLQDPNNKKYQAASWDMADSRTRKFAYQTPGLLNMVKAKAGPFTLLIMMATIVIYAALQLGFAEVVFSSLHFPAFDEQRYQLWRWFSHALLHFSTVHIAFNLLWWWQLGGDIEKHSGTLKLLQISLLSAAVSGAGQFWVEDANFGGLSGVVYALLGYIWITGQLAPEKNLSLPKPIVGFMLVWLVLGFVQPYMAIANTAHLAGLICGVALAWIDSRLLVKQRR